MYTYRYFIAYVTDKSVFGNQFVNTPEKLLTPEHISGLQDHLGGVTILNWQLVESLRNKKASIGDTKVADES